MLKNSRIFKWKCFITNSDLFLIIGTTVEPQSYGILSQLDTDIEYIFGNIIKISIKSERVINFSSVTQSFSFNISQLMLHSDHSCTFVMENVENSIKS